MGSVHRIEPSDKVGGVWWVYGNPGSGKTRVATSLDIPDKVVLDADDYRELWPEIGFDKDGRIESNVRAAKLALKIWHQGHNVVVASVCPYPEIREIITRMIPWVTWVHVEGPFGTPIEENYDGSEE